MGRSARRADDRADARAPRVAYRGRGVGGEAARVPGASRPRRSSVARAARPGDEPANSLRQVRRVRSREPGET